MPLYPQQTPPSSLRPDSPPPLPHPLHPASILLEPLAQIHLRLLPLLAILEAVEVVLDAVVLAALFKLCLLLFCFFEARGAGAPAACHGHEAVGVGDGAGVL